MSMVRSPDGTPIAFERSGDGPPVILMGGALNDQAALAPLAELLAARFTVFNYDRRGRGASGMTLPYSMDREIEDLERVLAQAGGSAALFANCSGGMIAINALARGLPFTKLALYEPPFTDGQVDGKGSDHTAHITRLIEEDRRGDAVRYFMGEVVDMPAEAIKKISSGPAWPWLESLSPSLPYDVGLVLDNPIPTEQIAAIPVPTLVFDGTLSPRWMGRVAKYIVDTVPNGRRCSLPGHNHNLIADAVAPELIEFFSD